MSNLRKLAKGQSCQIRIPGAGAHASETVVLCHYRMAGFSGIGMKSPDWCAAWGCFDCHEIVDGRRRVDGMTRESVQLYHLQGCMRTLMELHKLGAVTL